MSILKLSDLKDACPEQRALFKQHFGQGGEVTLEKVLSVADQFDWHWAARHLLSRRALCEYNRVYVLLRPEYRRDIDLAWVEYKSNRTDPGAHTEYVRATASAHRKYISATAPAWFAGWEADHRKETIRDGR